VNGEYGWVTDIGTYEDAILFRDRRWFGIEVGIEVFGEDVDDVDDLISHGFSDECIL